MGRVLGSGRGPDSRERKGNRTEKKRRVRSFLTQCHVGSNNVVEDEVGVVSNKVFRG